MSDDEAPVEKSETTYTYAKSGRAGCKGPKSCPNKTIEKGVLRWGSVTERDGHPQTYWRHWSCVTKAILDKVSSTDKLAGFDDLNDEDKEKIKKAIETKENPDFEDTHSKAKAGGAAGSEDEGKSFPSKKLQQQAEKEAKKKEKEEAKALKEAEKEAKKKEKEDAKAAKAAEKEAKAAEKEAKKKEKEDAKAAKAAEKEAKGGKRKKADGDAPDSPNKRARAPRAAAAKKTVVEDDDEEEDELDE
ncbi:poly polymerase and DNA-ligase Zn-finger region-domain-containing protein [Hyaloraphidium curvatum]|nr:poly polymerase and DNA-ligase Zn-finger region-domain-containing protein [Hyaloraphidium curvatum]